MTLDRSRSLVIMVLFCLVSVAVTAVNTSEVHSAVISHQKISATEGGFTGPLFDGDRFGVGAASLGDLDGDGVVDIAVGAHFDSDAGVLRGAVWVLFLNPDGTVKGRQEINDTRGAFTGTLADGDFFGRSVASLGDLDNDGVVDLAVGAWGDDDGGGNRGAVWVLFLNANGTVKSHQKISATQGGFTGQLFDSDNFGAAVASPGDLDGDGVADLAVGAVRDDDGGTDRGAVWILFLNSDGTVKTHQKISDTQGGFTGVLDDVDMFGASVASLGDLDGDLIGDVAVGAFLDDDGGADRGAVWLLFLNSDGTVKSQQKISGTQGGFTGGLDDGDQFGVDAVFMGDQDGDGVGDLVVGANGDGDGGPNRGAVWLLFLNSDGTVKSQEKISGTQGGFAGALDDGDSFGVSVAALGDLDGDSVDDMLVGAFFDDDGGANRGSVWVLFRGACSIRPSGIDFGAVGVGGFKDTTFTIINSGQGSIGGTVFESCADYSILSGGGGYLLAPGDSLVVTVRFAPAGAGSDCTVFTGSTCGDVPLTGVGVQCLVQPSSIGFDTLAIGLTRDTTFTISNISAGTLNGVVSASCTDFSIVSGAGPYTLVPGESLVVAVRFEPLDIGPLVCSVTTGSLCAEVSLAGVGTTRLPPLISSIADVGNDQGRKVRITFLSSFFDAPASPTIISQYEAYRRIDPLPSAAPGVDGAGDGIPPRESRVRRAREAGMASDPGILDAGWDFIGMVPAHIAAEYNMIAPTLADSTISKGMHWSVFFIRAATPDPRVFFDSPVDSGYSLDNTPPPAPGGFAIAYNTGGGNQLSWNTSGAADFQAFDVYRGTVPDFTPSPGGLVHSTDATQWTDPVAGGWQYYYALTAVDSAGNASGPSSPGTVTGFGDAVPVMYALRQNVPNPFNPTTTISFEVPPGGGRVTLRIYDVQGKHLRTLVNGRETAGRKTVTWDGKDDKGQGVASGVYFYRMQAGSFERTLKMVLMK